MFITTLALAASTMTAINIGTVALNVAAIGSGIAVINHGAKKITKALLHGEKSMAEEPAEEDAAAASEVEVKTVEGEVA